MSRHTSAERVLGQDVHSDIRNTKVLMVGAGGIGCELLKNLVMVGIKNIEVIDLDTIDVSNLNRQFLFQRQHVGMSKAEVACNSVKRFDASVKVVPHHANVKSQQFGVGFYSQFDIVMNALDNLSARNHVNRMCLAADIPLIESGTAGYLGQSTVIKKNKFECFECEAKPIQKTYPTCTIRSTPSQPIHCIVWAKHLFAQLFGHADDDNDLSPVNEDGSAPKVTVDGSGTTDTNAAANDSQTQERVTLRVWAEQQEYNAESLFKHIFVDHIKAILELSDLWKERTPPVPVVIGVTDAVGESGDNAPQEKTKAGIRDQRVWGTRENYERFCQATRNLTHRVGKRSGDDKELSWDKDDDDAMDFVCAAANLRATAYHIPTTSRFSIKSMAGNIIPAIATTNAIVAGLMVLECFKVVRKDYDSCRLTFVKKVPNARGMVLVPVQPSPPNPDCPICGKPEIRIRCNTDKCTVGQLEDILLKGKLSMVQPDAEVGGRVIIDSEEPLEKVRESTFAQMKILDSAIITVDDSMQAMNFKITVIHTTDNLGEGNMFEIIGDIPLAAPAAPAVEPAKEAALDKQAVDNVTDKDDELTIIEDDVEEITEVGIAGNVEGDADTLVALTGGAEAGAVAVSKRKREIGEEGVEVPAASSCEKRTKTA